MESSWHHQRHRWHQPQAGSSRGQRWLNSVGYPWRVPKRSSQTPLPGLYSLFLPRRPHRTHWICPSGRSEQQRESHQKQLSRQFEDGHGVHELGRSSVACTKYLYSSSTWVGSSLCPTNQAMRSTEGEIEEQVHITDDTHIYSVDWSSMRVTERAISPIPSSQ